MITMPGPFIGSAARPTRTCTVVVAAAVLMLALHDVAVAGARAPVGLRALCPARTDDTMVVAHADTDGPQIYYTLRRCNVSNDLANGGRNHTTEPIDAAKHAGAVTLVDVANCSLSCLGRGAFDFPGAGNVTHLRMGHNPFAALPEELLWNMTSLVDISMEASSNLETLPKLLFKGQGRLAKLHMMESARLGAGAEQLPDELFEGLVSLVELDLSECLFIRSLPNLDDLAALKNMPMYANAGGSFQLSQADSATKFNRLASLDALILLGHSLLSVPSLRGLVSLTALWLANNKITSIAQGAFAGAPRLVSLMLGGNQITSVAPGAFDGLAALRVLPGDFAPVMGDGTGQPWHSSTGVGFWNHSDRAGYFSVPSDREDYSAPPISYSPNPVECVWKGPYLSSVDCSSCTLGYEAASLDNTTCVKPDFGPYRAWAANYSRLRLLDAGGGENSPTAHTDAPRLLTGHTYKIQAPLLEPKDKKFVGYAEPFTKIRYELDWTRGAEVDLGCGTMAVGDSTGDPLISKGQRAFLYPDGRKSVPGARHPNSMRRLSYQWPTGQRRATGNADPGYYMGGTRYQRFRVVRAGNFTFDTCGSAISLGINLYKRTSNLSASEPRVVPLDWEGSAGDELERREYLVPLHDYDTQFTNVSTGLVRVQPEGFGELQVAWLQSMLNDTAYPPITYPTHSTFFAVNGCSLSNGANRTYTLEAADYFLETAAATGDGCCGYFNIRMTCSGGAQATSPEESNPKGFTVDAGTGAITGTPQRVRDGYILRLRAVDAAEVRTDIAQWNFSVAKAPAFSLNPSAGWSAETNGSLESKYHVAETYILPKPNVRTNELLRDPAGENFEQVVYLLSVRATAGSMGNCTPAGTQRDKAISALTDVANGEGAINIKCEGSYSATLVVRDGAGNEVMVRSWNFTVHTRDTTVPAYGPNGRACANGNPVDGEEMDGVFTCDCDGTKYEGDNCEIATGPDTTPAAVVGAVLGVIVLAAAVIFLLLRWQRYARSMMATDFIAQLEAMAERGEVDERQATTGGVPRELKRGWLALVDTLGKGAFGEVWKGLLQDGGNLDIPSYMVACKVVKGASGGLDSAAAAAAEEELLKEALLMAQVKTHPHLVSLVGVITRGHPKVLVLSFCEHGELQGALKKRAADGDAFSAEDKCGFCKEVADGMAHLAAHNFVHRDLAARNVLLGSGMVCKVADFGLSRRVQTEDNTGDYYRSSSGVIPVRWTAPEGITSQKFSSASDVWSYGITCVEIFLDGGRPYASVNSNPDVVRLVCTEGRVHPRPQACPEAVYAELVKCWAADPDQRPEFDRLKAFFLAMRATMAAAAAPSSQRTGLASRGGGGSGLPPTPRRASSRKLANADDGGDGQPYDLGHQDSGAADTSTLYDLGNQDAGLQCYSLGWDDRTGRAAAAHASTTGPGGLAQPSGIGAADESEQRGGGRGAGSAGSSAGRGGNLLANSTL